MAEEVYYLVENGVATVTLNRPQAMNAVSAGMKEGLLGAFQAAARDDTVRAVVLTGAGRAFCVGQDLREHADALAAGEGVENTVREHYNPIVEAIAGLPKPVVAAVNGMAAGAGASLAFACDLRVAARDAGFLMAFTRVGLGPDSGSSWTLPRLVGHGRAMAMFLLAEPVTAEQALDLGLVSVLVDTEKVQEAALELALRLAAGPTVAFGVVKRTLAYAAQHSLTEALEYEADQQALAGATEDHRSATSAFLAKQRAAFLGR